MAMLKRAGREEGVMPLKKMLKDNKIKRSLFSVQFLIVHKYICRNPMKKDYLSWRGIMHHCLMPMLLRFWAIAQCMSYVVL